MPSGKQHSDTTPNGRPIEPMHEIRSLLMATDLSARSERALERALQLADQHGAALEILNIVDEDLPDAAQDPVAIAAKDEIEACVARMEGPEKEKVSIRILPGKDYRDIIDEADSAKADLLVLGIHRNESGNKPITGTTVERVIRHSSLPVLVAKDRMAGPYRKVMIAIDFSVFSRFAIRGALAVAPDADFFCVHAFRVPFEGFQAGRETRRAVQQEHERQLTEMIESEMAALIEAAPNAQGLDERMHKVVRHGDVHATLRAEADRLQPDLLVLGTHGRVGLSRMVLGSIAEDFLNQPPCDVLAVKAW
ncbi:MAG: universal stress protein [Alphaproteobacteria bacterium]|nr:universal stress protein [Alphaproteobacteria bacterium]